MNPGFSRVREDRDGDADRARGFARMSRRSRSENFLCIKQRRALRVLADDTPSGADSASHDVFTAPCRGLRHEEDEAMTRTETLALYRPIRVAIRRISGLAISVCDRADMMRAAKQLGCWAKGTIVLPDESAIGMLSDVALFEPNRNGRRAFDRFL
jgi:hypothetical protein